MARKDPMQEQIERIQRGEDPQRPINPIGTPKTRNVAPRSVGATGGVLGGIMGQDIPEAKRSALDWLLGALRIRR